MATAVSTTSATSRRSFLTRSRTALAIFAELGDGKGCILGVDEGRQIDGHCLEPAVEQKLLVGSDRLNVHHAVGVDARKPGADKVVGVQAGQLGDLGCDL